MQKRVCPHCGHENVDRAVFCFRCGANLEDPPTVRGIRHRRHFENVMRSLNEHADSLAPELVEKLRKARTHPDLGTETALVTCLRCGTLNPALTGYCIGCGASLSVPDPSHTIRLVPRASAHSNVGRVRDNNEDRVGLWARQGIVLAMVADGMGGAVAGEEASRLVTEAVQADFLGEARGSETLFDLSEDEVADKLRRAVRRGNQAVIEQASQRPELQGMGTTVTLAFVRDNRVIIAHVGDSRAYLVDGQEGWINQISDDHSFVEALLSSGHITPEQAAVHPMRNVLYRALGQVEDTDADLYSRTLAEGDRLILCSDGLTRHVDADEIARIAMSASLPGEIAQKLISLANQRGGEDNISVIVVIMERAGDVEVDALNDAALLEDTQIGLYHPEGTDSMPDGDTQELPNPWRDSPEESQSDEAASG